MGLLIKIVTPKGLYASLDATSLNIRLTSGYRTILKNHTPLIGALDIAPMHIKIGDKTNNYAIHKGAINITKDGVTIITNAIEKDDEIDLLRASSSKSRAEERLLSKDNIDINRAKDSLKRALTRIEVAKK